MIKQDDLRLLYKLEQRVADKIGMHGYVDIKPIAKELGLDMDNIMKEVGRVCDTRNYNVGGHMMCTRHNVLPAYKEKGELVLDKDHVEGLRQILAVELGLRKDY